MATDFEEGMLVGLLIGEGHFGGDGRQPHVTLRMHERHEALFRWIEHTFPGGRLYGPYDHGGRRYYQWMARGTFLRDELVPLLERRFRPSIDRYAHSRFQAMCGRYPRQLGSVLAETPLDRPSPQDPNAPHRPREAAAIFAALRGSRPEQPAENEPSLEDGQAGEGPA